MKTFYTLSVLLKPKSPNSLNLAWKVLKADTIRLQPWLIIRRASWLYIVAYTNGCRRLQRRLTTQRIITFFLATGNLGMESGVYQSGRPFWPKVYYHHDSGQFSSFQSLNHIWLFAIPWIAACQASLSISNSQSSLRLASIESVMPSSHLILSHPLLLLPQIPPSIR